MGLYDSSERCFLLRILQHICINGYIISPCPPGVAAVRLSTNRWHCQLLCSMACLTDAGYLQMPKGRFHSGETLSITLSTPAWAFNTCLYSTMQSGYLTKADVVPCSQGINQIRSRLSTLKSTLEYKRMIHRSLHQRQTPVYYVIHSSFMIHPNVMV